MTTEVGARVHAHCTEAHFRACLGCLLIQCFSQSVAPQTLQGASRAAPPADIPSPLLPPSHSRCSHQASLSKYSSLPPELSSSSSWKDSAHPSNITSQGGQARPVPAPLALYILPGVYPSDHLFPVWILPPCGQSPAVWPVGRNLDSVTRLPTSSSATLITGRVALGSFTSLCEVGQ